jgi:hypothetical protein
MALSAIPSLGQTLGEVTGHIGDSTGASVPAASITLTNVATNHPGQPGTNAHQGFGVVGSTSTNMRQTQLGLKYSF